MILVMNIQCLLKVVSDYNSFSNCVRYVYTNIINKTNEFYYSELLYHLQCIHQIHFRKMCLGAVGVKCVCVFLIIPSEHICKRLSAKVMKAIGTRLRV